MKLTEENWTHYLYIIRFVDGFYYTGVSKRKGDDPALDKYYGSCLDRSKWLETMYGKEVIAYLWANSHEEAYEEETGWQKLNYRLEDSLCLNKHFGSTNFKEESSKRGGHTQGNRNVEKNLGFWRDDIKRKRSEIGRVGGLKGGKKAVDTGQLARAREKAWRVISKSVILIHIKTGEREIHPSLHAAARSINGSASALCNVLKGHRNSHKGFKVEYTQG